MVKIQIDLSEKENKIVKIYQMAKNFDTKEKAIKDMILQQTNVAKAFVKNL